MIKVPKVSDVVLLPTEQIPTVYNTIVNVSNMYASQLKAGILAWIESKYGPQARKLADDLFKDVDVGEPVANALIELTGQHYLHAGLFVGVSKNAVWTLEATFTGVKLVLHPLKSLARFDIYTCEEVDSEKIQKVILDFWNRPYDLPALIREAIAEILGVFHLEKWFEDQIKYNNPHMLICSELVARVYEKAGYKLFDNPEDVSPQDIADHPKFVKLV